MSVEKALCYDANAARSDDSFKRFETRAPFPVKTRNAFSDSKANSSQLLTCLNAPSVPFIQEEISHISSRAITMQIHSVKVLASNHNRGYHANA
ncbi:hypothetical protein AVEN_41940-1 [Araneus ventricosus]|uniref:Uncharacterized protein n=1 Tax=Araneus ventricosus TaxID=182803 RepID=A0A4Y2ACT9_ARAVE|nr:hypothetical protein AVEN_41940-1 [Araneus ventricosus]